MKCDGGGGGRAGGGRLVRQAALTAAGAAAVVRLGWAGVNGAEPLRRLPWDGRRLSTASRLAGVSDFWR